MFVQFPFVSGALSAATLLAAEVKSKEITWSPNRVVTAQNSINRNPILTRSGGEHNDMLYKMLVF